ncbi:KIF13B, partial [Symbiodinium necroappetens]
DEARTRIRNSTLNLIDLAGSERVKKSGAAGQRMREGQNINSSLSVLGQVISKLAQGKFKHVPFRQSKLTYLLTDALNGNSKTHMVAAISPALSEMEETLGTLRFASSVKKVRTHAVSNEQDVGESDLLLQTMRSEAEELKAAAIKAREESPQQARRLEIHAEAVEHAVISMQTRIDKTMWSQAQQAQQEATRQALAGLSLPFAIGGMLGGQSQDGVTANSPYLLNISDDISLAGRLLYFLPEGPPISVGSGENNRIRLMGLGIPDRLCDISVVAGGKGVEVQHSGGGRLMVDGIQVSENQAAALYNGARIIFGRSLAFRLAQTKALKDTRQSEKKEPHDPQLLRYDGNQAVPTIEVPAKGHLKLPTPHPRDKAGLRARRLLRRTSNSVEILRQAEARRQLNRRLGWST